MAGFKRLGTEVVGVSTDSIDTLVSFQQKTPAPQQFVSDPSASIAKAYGVSVGVGPIVRAKRETFVIGRNGKILFSYFDWAPETNVNKTYAWLQQHPQE